MSYILDALRKAAEQRDVHAPAMQRLFTPDPETADTPRWRLALLGAGAAFAGAAAVSAFWLLWPTAPVVVPDRADATPATARVQPEPSPAAIEPPPPPTPPIVRTTPAAKPSAASGAASAPATPAPAAAPAPAKTAAETRPPAAVAEARAAAETRRPATESSRRPEPAPAPEPGARPRPAPPTPSVITSLRTPPAGTSPTARGEQGSPMRLEVIVYSEERARRLAFINGRKYVEGDTLVDGARIQEIQPNAVVIIDDGRRVVLRP